MTRWILLLAAVALIGTTARGEVAKFDFRKKKYDDRWFQYNGVGASTCIEPADDGLRIFFPNNTVPKEPVGIVWNCRLRGDFTATARYAILQADQTAQGSGIEMYLMLDNKNADGIPVLRVNRGGDGLVFNCMVRTNDEKKQRISRGFQQARATPDSDRGRIKVERKGADFFAALAEGDEEEFKTVLTIENIGTEDVRMLRFAGISRGAKEAKLDIRLLDFHLKGELLNLPGGTGEKEPTAPPGAPEQLPALSQTGSGRWTLWLVIILGGVLLLVFLAVLALVGLSRMKGKAPVMPTKGGRK